jgi:ribosomal protein S18 acetylase RimI-like enzyme
MMPAGDRFEAHLNVGMEEVLRGAGFVVSARVHLRMVATSDGLAQMKADKPPALSPPSSPPPPPTTTTTTPTMSTVEPPRLLTADDAAACIDLCGTLDCSWFEPHCLESGVYYGIYDTVSICADARVDSVAGADASADSVACADVSVGVLADGVGSHNPVGVVDVWRDTDAAISNSMQELTTAQKVLVAMAGTHVLATSYKVAALGNIVTRAAWRRRGHGKEVTRALCLAVATKGVQTIALNVTADNEAAIAMYKALHFEQVMEFVECDVQRGCEVTQ